jgi:hypothetical protein
MYLDNPEMHCLAVSGLAEHQQSLRLLPLPTSRTPFPNAHRLRHPPQGVSLVDTRSDKAMHWLLMPVRGNHQLVMVGCELNSAVCESTTGKTCS